MWLAIALNHDLGGASTVIFLVTFWVFWIPRQSGQLCDGCALDDTVFPVILQAKHYTNISQDGKYELRCFVKTALERDDICYQLILIFGQLLITFSFPSLNLISLLLFFSFLLPLPDLLLSSHFVTKMLLITLKNESWQDFASQPFLHVLWIYLFSLLQKPSNKANNLIVMKNSINDIIDFHNSTYTSVSPKLTSDLAWNGVITLECI